MVILPLDDGKFSHSHPTKDPVVQWYPTPKPQVMEEPSWPKLEEFGVVPRCLEDTNISTGVAVGLGEAIPAVNTGSRGEHGGLHQEKRCHLSSTVPVSKAVTSQQKMVMEKVAMKISFAPDRLGNRHPPTGEIPLSHPKIVFMVADSPGGHCWVTRRRPKIRGQSLSPSLEPPLLHAGAARRSHL